MRELAKTEATRLELVETLPPEAHYLPARRYWLTLRVNRRTGAVWFVLFVMVVTLVLFVPFGLIPSFMGATVLLMVGATYTGVVTYRASEEAQRAQVLLHAGQIDEAAAVLEHLCLTQQDHPHHAVFVFLRAVAYTRTGRHRRAFSLLNSVHRSGILDRRLMRAHAGQVEALMAFTLALAGELQAAERYVAAAERKLPAEHRGAVVFPRTVTLARSGDFERARAYAEAHHRELVSSDATKRALRLVWAWVAESDETAGAAEVKRLVDGLYPIQPGEFDWVCTDWPELREFARTIDAVSRVG